MRSLSNFLFGITEEDELKKKCVFYKKNYSTCEQIKINPNKKIIEYFCPYNFLNGKCNKSPGLSTIVELNMFKEDEGDKNMFEGGFLRPKKYYPIPNPPTISKEKKIRK